MFGCYKRWPCVRPFQVSVSFGFVILFMLLFVRFSTCFGLCPFILSLAPSFSSWDLPFCSCMFFLTLIYFLGRFVVLPIFYYCSALFMYSLFFYILCVLILLCFRRDFCFLLFPSYSRGLFLRRRAFVLFSYSRGFSFLFYVMRFSFTSP